MTMYFGYKQKCSHNFAAHFLHRKWNKWAGSKLEMYTKLLMMNNVLSSQWPYARNLQVQGICHLQFLRWIWKQFESKYIFFFINRFQDAFSKLCKAIQNIFDGKLSIIFCSIVYFMQYYTILYSQSIQLYLTCSCSWYYSI